MIVTINDLESIRSQHTDKVIVSTSGTFDLLHTGHLNYLEKVREHGDILVVLMSGDKRVKARKGNSRPIINENDRARMLESLKIVDYVMIDPALSLPNEVDPVHSEILQKLQPNFYVTDGPDPRFVNIIEKSMFIILDRMHPEPSTSSIIKRIIEINLR